MSIIASFDGVQVEYSTVPKIKLAYIHHRPRVSGLNYSPDTAPMQDRGTGQQKGRTIPIRRNWWEYLQKINSPKGYEYTRSVGLMWVNIDYDRNTPYSTARAESIHCGGNFLEWDIETDTHVRVVSYPNGMDTSALNPQVDNWHNKPHRFWKACSIDLSGHVIKVANGLDVYFPLICNVPEFGLPAELWMRKDMITTFPPAEYTFRDGDVYLRNELFYRTGVIK
jgi:hypothetical protein